MDDITRPSLNKWCREIGRYITKIATISFDDLRILFRRVINAKRHNHFERSNFSRRWNNHNLTAGVIHTVCRVCRTGFSHIVIVVHIEIVIDDNANAIWNIKRASTSQG